MNGSVKEAVEQRLKELEPLIEERDRLTAFLKEFAGTEVPQSNGNGRTPSVPNSTRKAGHNKRGDKTRELVLTMASRKPGVTISEIAKKKKISTSHAYAVVKSLAEEGVVTRDKGQVFPKEEIAA